MWTVRYERIFDEQIDEYRDHEGPCRIDDVIDGVEWALANEPERWAGIDGLPFRVVRTEPVVGVPGLLVAYSLDHDQKLVSLEFMTPIEAFDEEDLPD